MIMEGDPNVLIEGMTVAGIAVGATKGDIYLRSEYPHAQIALNQAISAATRHRAKEFIHFLGRIDRSVRKTLDIHLVLDNYGTHNTPEVKAWLAKHPRFHLHFTPTSASWLNLVER